MIEPKDEESKISDTIEIPKVCKHIVKRKKRFCRMTVAKDQEYCGEHLPTQSAIDVTGESAESAANGKIRIPCPLDPKHTIYAQNLGKHLKICNAKQTNLPSYVVPGINRGTASVSDESNEDYSQIKLNELETGVIDEITNIVNKLYVQDVEGTITKLILEHPVLKDECNNPTYGEKSLKHLIQTSSLLGYLKHFDFIKDETCFMEFGAGKAQLSYWLSEVISDLKRSNIILIDKASHRNKKENKVADRNIFQRVRVDITNLSMNALDLKDARQIIGISKHLCGAATDLAMRCILNANAANADSDGGGIKTKGLIVAVCCHHRCEWKSFVGKKYFEANGLGEREFVIITKMVGWAICGTGFSRERRKELEEANEEADHSPVAADTDHVTGLSRQEKEMIGFRCKRIIDHARLLYFQEMGFKCSLNYYVESSTTLENVCFVSSLVE